jgi:predicted membrane channel-forming protein YqfA (hemolysin III family)
MVAEFELGDLMWSMLAFFFWFMLIWMFIMVFADIFRRRDLSGGAKAGWILLIFILPLFGILIYVIARPSVTDQDREMASAAAAQGASGYSSPGRSA